MNSKIKMSMLFCFCVFQLSAQFTDDMEWDPGNCPPWWTTWINSNDCPLVASPGNNSNQAGYVAGDGISDYVLDLGNKIFGEWGLEFYVYIPSNKEAYMNLQGQVPVGSGEWIVGNIFFNQDLVSPGVGLIDDSALGEVTFNFPHDEWFKIVMNYDISLGISTATWQLAINDVEVIPSGTPFTNENGTTATSLGGLNFFGYSANSEMYIDDFTYTSGFIDTIYYAQEDMEYTSGEAFADWWFDCPSSCPVLTDVLSRSGDQSALIPDDGTTEFFYDFYGQNTGQWSLEFYVNIPSGKEAFFSLQDILPASIAGEVGNFEFNENNNHPGIGFVTNTATGVESFPFEHDQWIQVLMLFDFNGSEPTWELSIGGYAVFPSGYPFRNISQGTPANLGGIRFFSSSSLSQYYLDDINFAEVPELGIEQSISSSFTMFPNPASNSVNVTSSFEILSVQIYNLHGVLIQQYSNIKILDVSSLAKGMYFVEVTTEKGKSAKKMIRN